LDIGRERGVSETRYKRKIVQFQMHRFTDVNGQYQDCVTVLDSDGKMWSRNDGSDGWFEEPELPPYWPLESEKVKEGGAK